MGTATRLMRRIPDQLGRPGGADAGKAQPLPAAGGRVEWFARRDMVHLLGKRTGRVVTTASQLPRLRPQIQAIPSQKNLERSPACTGVLVFDLPLKVGTRSEASTKLTGDAFANGVDFWTILALAGQT